MAVKTSPRMVSALLNLGAVLHLMVVYGSCTALIHMHVFTHTHTYMHKLNKCIL